MTTTPPTTLYLDPSFGASGDMLLGTLVGLGVDLEAVCAVLVELGLDDWSITQSTLLRAGLSATRVEVTVPPAAHDHDQERHRSQPTRRWSAIDHLIATASLPDRVREGARATFRRLGEIEADAHGVSIEEVHFHEVGAVDSIVDIVGVWLALHHLGPASVVIGPVGIGYGTVASAHGMLPLPAPATASLLAGAPIRSIDAELETCTPTGAALLATIGEWGLIPSGTLVASARGAGGRDPATHPNVISGHLIEPASTPVPVPASSQAAVILETNLDDVTPEVLGYLIDRLLAAGADDAWITPIVMKKSRPAHRLAVLASPALGAELRAIISAETHTLGIREIIVSKFPLDRRTEHVELDGHSIRIKVGPHGAKPEHDDLVAVAAATGRPLRSLAEASLELWRDKLHS